MSKFISLESIAFVLLLLAFIWRFCARKGNENEFVKTHQQYMRNLRSMMYVEMVCWIITLVMSAFIVIYSSSEPSNVLKQIDNILPELATMALLLRYVLFLKNDQRSWNDKIDDYSNLTLICALMSIKDLCFPQYAGISILKITIILLIVNLIKNGLKIIGRYFRF